MRELESFAMNGPAQKPDVWEEYGSLLSPSYFVRHSDKKTKQIKRVVVKKDVPTPKKKGKNA